MKNFWSIGNKPDRLLSGFCLYHNRGMPIQYKRRINDEQIQRKGCFVKENAPIYFTPHMDRTAKWFEDVLGWYSNIVERDSQGRGLYGCVFDVPPEIEAAGIAAFTGFQLFAGKLIGNEISFMQVQGIDRLHQYVTGRGWNKITPVETRPWGGKVCLITTIDGYTIRIFE